MRAGETLLHLSDKRMLLRGGGALALTFAAGGLTVLTVEGQQMSTQIVRECVFAGDTILRLDGEEITTKAELLELLEEKPPATPLKLTLFQPAVAAAIAQRVYLSEQTRAAVWVSCPIGFTPAGRRSGAA